MEVGRVRREVESKAAKVMHDVITLLNYEEYYYE